MILATSTAIEENLVFIGVTRERTPGELYWSTAAMFDSLL